LKKQPANLTQLAAKNAGVFPAQEVREFIDGTRAGGPHGTRAMPIWGNAFRASAHTGAGAPSGTLNIAKKIDALVGYVKSLQQK
jgi:hypothetical protein